MPISEHNTQTSGKRVGIQPASHARFQFRDLFATDRFAKVLSRNFLARRAPVLRALKTLSTHSRSTEQASESNLLQPSDLTILKTLRIFCNLNLIKLSNTGQRDNLTAHSTCRLVGKFVTILLVSQPAENDRAEAGQFIEIPRNSVSSATHENNG